MNRLPQFGPADRSDADVLDARDLRSAILAALHASPVDEHALRRGIWTYVLGERHARTPPGRVIMSVTDMVESAPLTAVASQETLRRVILWCVEAYFGHLGGDGLGGADGAAAAAPLAPTHP